MRRTAKVRVGDVFEILTDRGLAYAQYTHRNPLYGELIRVLPGFFDQRPSEYGELVRRPARFCTFFPLRAAAAKRVVIIVANEPVPAEAQGFPIFRAGVVNPTTGKVDVWWLWDGDKEWRVGQLSEQERRLPIRGVWNDTLLIERITSGWTPETDPT